MMFIRARFYIFILLEWFINMWTKKQARHQFDLCGLYSLYLCFCVCDNLITLVSVFMLKLKSENYMVLYGIKIIHKFMIFQSPVRTNLEIFLKRPPFRINRYSHQGFIPQNPCHGIKNVPWEIAGSLLNSFSRSWHFISAGSPVSSVWCSLRAYCSRAGLMGWTF